MHGPRGKVWGPQDEVGKLNEMTDAFERLAADRVYEFDYFLTKNAIRGTVAGTALRPLAMR